MVPRCVTGRSFRKLRDFSLIQKTISLPLWTAAMDIRVMIVYTLAMAVVTVGAWNSVVSFNQAGK